MSIYYGVDFSGGKSPWRHRIARPTVWIATVEAAVPMRLNLIDLRPVQELDGEGNPYDRLIHHLKTSDFRAAGIDAPFALPIAHMPHGGHGELLRQVGQLKIDTGRPFPTGALLVDIGCAVCAPASAKPLRETERNWSSQRVNTRSTMWNKARGGAPFAAACIYLLAKAGRPIWPWDQAAPGMLVEAFPAAQLKHWHLPHQGYSKPDQGAVRQLILDGIGQRIGFDDVQRDRMLSSPDALDAVLCAFGAIAAASGCHVKANHDLADGLIAVMDR